MREYARRDKKDDNRPTRGSSQDPRKKKLFNKKRTCRFCTDQEAKIDYRDSNGLRPFVTERGKIIPRRTTGTCAKHQRVLTKAVKRARNLAIMPYTIHASSTL